MKECEHDWRLVNYQGWTFRKCQKCKRLEGWGFEKTWTLVSKGKKEERRKRNEPNTTRTEV